MQFLSVILRRLSLFLIIGPLSACIVQPTLQGIAELCALETYTVNRTTEIPSTEAEPPRFRPVDYAALCLPGGECSIRAALHSAAVCRATGPKTILLPENADIAVRFEHFAPAITSSLDRTERLGIRRTVGGAGPVRLPRIYGDVTIEGRGTTLRVEQIGFPEAPNDNPRLFHVTRNGTFSLRNLTITNASAANTGRQAEARSGGGSVVLNDGQFTADGVTFFRNTQPITNFGFARIRPGSEFTENNASILNMRVIRINGVSFQREAAASGWSSLFNREDGDAQLLNSIIAENQNGVAMINEGNFEIIFSSIHNNNNERRLSLSTISQRSGVMRVSASTFYDNGIVFDDDPNVGTPGVILCRPSLRGRAQLILEDVTMANNQTNPTSGAINTVETCDVVLSNTLIVDNVGNDCNLTGTSSEAAISADSDGTCGVSRMFARPNTARLGPFGLNRGDTPSLLPNAGSPAIDAGGACGYADQRLVLRPQGNACDIGAVETLVDGS